MQDRTQVSAQTSATSLWRQNTERPITIEQGTNTLVGPDPRRIVAEATKIMDGDVKQGTVPELWDGCSAERLVAVLRQGIQRR